MPMRSQLDTSMYRGMGSGNTSLGEIMSAVSGITNMARSAKENRKKDEEDEDLRYVNSVVGKYMQGYDGSDPNDGYQRKQGAYNEIMTTRPELSRYTMPMQEKDTTGLQNYQKNELGMQNDRLTLDNSKEVLKQNQRTNLDAETKRKIERSMEAAQKLSEVQDEFGYGKVLQDYGDVLGEIDPYYQNYATSQHPATAFWRSKAGQIKQQRLAAAQREIEDRDLSVREKEAGIGKSDAEIKYKGAQSSDLYSQIKKRQWDMDHPKTDPKTGTRFGSLAGFNAPETLANAGEAMGHATNLKKLIDSGDAKWWERGWQGNFLNPDFQGSFDFLANYKGRKDSGAAINEKEWRVFRDLVANQKMMASPEGRAKVSSMLEGFLGNIYVQGVLQSKGNEGWYDDYQELSKYANDTYGFKPKGAQQKATDDDIILKYLGGK